MRDLINNYKMVIRGKYQDSDTETEPLTSSSSSTQNFGTCREPAIFKQENYSTESEEDTKIQPLKVERSSISPYTIQNSVKTQLFPSTPEVHIFSNPESVYNSPYSTIKLDSDLLPGQKDLLSSYESLIGFSCEENHTSTHNSLVTIFAIWNTTMGSSLLAMSWGLEKSGLFSGILINILVAALCLYTAYILLKVNEKHGILGQQIEVPDLCRMLIGRWAEILAKIFSLIVLVGANIVYWILMANFLYNSVHFLSGLFTESENQTQTTTVICPKEAIFNGNNTAILAETANYVPSSNFDKIWDLYSTVPVFLAIIMFPLLNFKSPTFFTKFNSAGTISVGYLLLFVAIKSFNWGINMQNWSTEFYLKPTFCALTGMLSLSYFIHNIIISIMRHNKHPEHNGRDLSIAFGLITFTYIFIGVVFYISFPLAKTCIEDNILNNFTKRDTLAILARILFLFQLFTVFPLMCFMLRNDVIVTMNMIFKQHSTGNFSYGKVILMNATVIFVCIMFACFLPRIGTLIRYTGALSGLVYIFMLPNMLVIASLKKQRALTMSKSIFHILIICCGVLNLFSQFFIVDN